MSFVSARAVFEKRAREEGDPEAAQPVASDDDESSELILSLEVVGLKHHNIYAVASSLAVGDAVELQREPANVEDMRAVCVLAATQEKRLTIGHLNWEHAKELAPHLDGRASSAAATRRWRWRASKRSCRNTTRRVCGCLLTPLASGRRGRSP